MPDRRGGAEVAVVGVGAMGAAAFWLVESGVVSELVPVDSDGTERGSWRSDAPRRNSVDVFPGRD